MSDWTLELLRRQEEERRKTRLKASAESDYNPDLARRVVVSSMLTNLPQDVVAADLDGIEGLIRRKEFDYDKYTDVVNGSPVFNKFAAENPYNLAVLERDRKSLTRFERALAPAFGMWDSGWAMVEMTDIYERQFAGDAREGDKERIEELRALISGGSFGAEGILQNVMAHTAQQAVIMGWILANSADETLAGANLGAAYGTVFGAVGTGAGALAGAHAGLIAGSINSARQLERALAYDQYIELGLPEADARAASDVVGVINGVAERFGLAALTKRLPGFKNIQRNATDKIVGRIFKNPTIRNARTKLAIAYGEGMATEIITEVFQESTTMAAQEYLKSRQRAAGDMRPEMQPMGADEFFGALEEIAIKTMYGVAVLGGAGPVMQYRQDARNARYAREQKAAWEALNEAAEESTTRKEAKTAWDRFVAMQREHGEVKDVGVDAKGFKEYFQSQGIDPVAAAKEVGVELTEADLAGLRIVDGEEQSGVAFPGSDIVIPFEKFIDKIVGTEHFKGLLPSVRMRADGMSFGEQAEWYKNQKEIVGKLEKTLQEQHGVGIDERIVNDVKEDLLATYADPKVAEDQARIHAAQWTKLALMQNVDPYTLFKQKFKGVRAEVPVALAGRDVDMDVDPMLERIKNNDFPLKSQFLGPSLIDFMRASGGIAEEGGELSARDFAKQFPGVQRVKGLSFDAMAELAFEQGYIPAYDQGMLLEAIDRELEGTQVFSRTFPVDEQLQELRERMDEAVDFLDQEGIDYRNMTIPEIRKALQGIVTYEQSDLTEWTKLLLMASKEDPSLLVQAWGQMPRVSEKQDFSSITFTDKFVDERGKTGTIKQNAQQAFDDAVAERNVLKQLVECVDG